MRLAVVSDVHANLPALRAVARDAAAAGVDSWLFLGDAVGYGPHPNECVEEIAALGAACVAGNHDLMAVGALPLHGTTLALESLAWTRRVLTSGTGAALASWPRSRSYAGVDLAHGSPADPQEYVRGSERAATLLDELGGGSTLLLLGHTHEPWAFARRAGTLALGRAAVVPLARGERHVLNPGSVGQSRARSPDARYLLLDLDARVADFRAVPYDATAVGAALAAAGLPEGSWHLRPPRFERARDRMRRLRP
jgi:predicted phosphodiesterase